MTRRSIRPSEGDVVITRSGTDVFVSEGFALPLARKLQELVEGAQATGPVQMRGGLRWRAGDERWGACGIVGDVLACGICL